MSQKYLYKGETIPTNLVQGRRIYTLSNPVNGPPETYKSYRYVGARCSEYFDG